MVQEKYAILINFIKKKKRNWWEYEFISKESKSMALTSGLGF